MEFLSVACLCRLSLRFWLHCMSFSLSKCCTDIGLVLLPGIFKAPFCLRALAHVTFSWSAISHAVFKFGSFFFSSSFNVTCLRTTFLTTLPSMCFPSCYSLRLHSVYFLHSTYHNWQLSICWLACFSVSPLDYQLHEGGDKLFVY